MAQELALGSECAGSAHSRKTLGDAADVEGPGGVGWGEAFSSYQIEHAEKRTYREATY